MLELYVKEFVAVIDYVIQKELGIVQKDSIAVEKDIINQMLQRNMYEEPREKLNVWKSLRWIDTEKDRHTKMVRIDKGTKRLIVINLGVYKTLKRISENTLNKG